MTPTLTDRELREQLTRRWSALQTERSSWVSHWRDIGTHLLPRAPRFFVDDRNKGDRRNTNILDGSATRALGVLGAGMMAGMTSPARPWFRLTTSDPQLDEVAAVKQWLADVQRLMMMVFAKGNTYRALHAVYLQLGAFGTGPSVLTPDYYDVVRHCPLTVGSYAVAADERDQVGTLYRELSMTVAQMARKFGLQRCSQTVRTLHDRGQLDTWISVIHAIEPRDERDLRKRDARNMAWRSVYFEVGAAERDILSESGFKTFPALVPRWLVWGEDIYGESPAMEVLGDIRQLQHQQLRKGQVIDRQTLPPLQMPSSLKSQQINTLPGGATFIDTPGSQPGVRPLFDTRTDLQHLLLDIQDVRERIRGSFFADLFLMLASQPAAGRMTATEVAERHEEKMLMLGPVVERVNNELAAPMIEATFAQMASTGIVPPAPAAIQGRELNVEFVSMLAQAQRAIATNSIDRFTANLGVIAQIKPEVLDKLDADRWADVYADMLGVDPDIVVPGEQVTLIRSQRAKALAEQQQAAQMQQQAATAKDLAAAKTDSPSALTNVIDMFSGYTS